MMSVVCVCWGVCDVNGVCVCVGGDVNGGGGGGGVMSVVCVGGGMSGGGGGGGDLSVCMRMCVCVYIMAYCIIGH